jgi:hypothetical protein
MMRVDADAHRWFGGINVTYRSNERASEGVAFRYVGRMIGVVLARAR